jgi:hypothetical protein
MKSLLRRWRGRERSMMDCRLKKLKAGHIGLNMGLCPGFYEGRKSRGIAIHIAETIAARISHRSAVHLNR